MVQGSSPCGPTKWETLNLAVEGFFFYPVDIWSELPERGLLPLTGIHTRYRSSLGTRLEDFLTESLPKYLWRVTALHDQEAILDMVFDATGIAQHNLVLQTITLNSELATMLQVALPQVIPQITEGHLKNILQELAPEETAA